MDLSLCYLARHLSIRTLNTTLDIGNHWTDIGIAGTPTTPQRPPAVIMGSEYLTANGLSSITNESTGLDAITFATLFVDGIQVKCPAAIVGKCEAPGNCSLSSSSHRCFMCGCSLHCVLFCGEDAASWFSNNVKIGLNASMLPPYGRSKLNEYNGIPPDGQTICANCIDSIDAKIAEKPKSRTVSPTLSVDSASNSTATSRCVHRGTQNQCAAGNLCKMGSAAPLSTNPDHRCLVCNLFMHPNLHMCGLKYCSWLVKTSKEHGLEFSVTRSILSSDSLSRIGSSPSGDIGFCASCVNALKPKVLSLLVDTEGGGDKDDGNDDGDVALVTEAGGDDPSKTKKANAAKWKAFAATVTGWRNIVVSVSAVNEVSNSKKGELTKIEAFRVGDVVMPIGDIPVDTLRKICTNRLEEKVNTRGGEKNSEIRKGPLCDRLLAFRADMEKQGWHSTEPSSVAAQRKNTSRGRKAAKPRCFINVPRMINVVFSDDFKDRFATRGAPLTKDELEAKKKTDQTLWIDFVVAYLDASNYGTDAHPDLVLEQEVDPSDFQQDGIDTNDWQKFQKRFNALIADYEKVVKLSTKSGQHEEVDIENLELKDCNNDDILYLHASMQSNKSIYSACGAFLADDVFSDSARKTNASGNCKRKKSSGEGDGVLTRAITVRMTSDVSKNRAATQNLALDSETKAAQLRAFYEAQQDEAEQKKRAAKKTLLEKLGDEKKVEERVEMVKKKKAGTLPDVGHLSQETACNDYLRYHERVAEHQANIDRTKKTIEKINSGRN